MDDRIFQLPATQYRRDARRLRAQYGTDPGRLYGALRELANEHDMQRHSRPRMRLVVDAEEPADDFSSPATDHDPEQFFMADVRAVVQDGVIRFSDRQTLLQKADALRLHRFRANLLLAMALHELSPPIAVSATRVNPAAPLLLSAIDPRSARIDRRLRALGLLDLLMATIFVAALFCGTSTGSSSSLWTDVAMVCGTMVFLICPLVFWGMRQRA